MQLHCFAGGGLQLELGEFKLLGGNGELAGWGLTARSAEGKQAHASGDEQGKGKGSGNNEEDG